MATASPARAAPFVPRGSLPRLPIIDSYILQEMALPFVAALGLFFIFWFGNIFFLSADYIINAHAPPLLVLRYVAFRVPQSTPYAFPFACLAATLLAFGRLAADNELTALRTSGIPFTRICLAPLAFGMVAFLTSYAINESIEPRAVELSTRTFYQIIYHTETLPIIPHIFQKDDTTGNVIYVGNVEGDHKTMEDVMIFENAASSPFQRVINAAHGVIENETLHLTDARITDFKSNGQVNGFSPARDVRIGLPLGQTVDQFLNTASSDPTSQDSKALSNQIKAMKLSGQGGQALDFLEITLAQRFAFPFASFIAVVIALPLATRFGKKGRMLGIALSLVLYFVYYLMMAAFTALGKNEAINPLLAAWLPNIIMGGTGAYFFRTVDR